jgi:hypothetical protein
MANRGSRADLPVSEYPARSILLAMQFRTDAGNQPLDQEEVNAFDPTLPPNDDQRSHPRGSAIEKIADIAYDTLRKHEGAWQSDDSQNDTGEDLAS